VELPCYGAKIRVCIHSGNAGPLEECEDSLEEDRTPKDNFTVSLSSLSLSKNLGVDRC